MKKIIGENKYVIMGTIGDIALVQYKDDVLVGLDAAKEIVALRLSLFPTDHDYVIYVNKISCVTTEALAYFSSEGYLKIRRAAYVVKPFFSRLIVNAFLTLYRSGKPSEVFSNQTDAVAWLTRSK